MKLLVTNLIFVGFLICFGCDKNESDRDSECQNPNDELISWTIIDDVTGNSIGDASGTIFYGAGFGEFVSFAAAENGIGVFCFPIGGVVVDGFIRAEGYIDLDLTNLIPSDITILRMIPLE